jgi:hypothetical protein
MELSTFFASCLLSEFLFAPLHRIISRSMKVTYRAQIQAGIENIGKD